MIADYWANGGRSNPISPQEKRIKEKVALRLLLCKASATRFNV